MHAQVDCVGSFFLGVNCITIIEILNNDDEISFFAFFSRKNISDVLFPFSFPCILSL